MIHNEDVEVTFYTKGIADETFNLTLQGEGNYYRLPFSIQKLDMATNK